MSEFNVLKRKLPIAFSITFDSNGGSSCQSIEAQVGEKYGELPTPTRSHYKFTGWHLDSPSGETVTSNTLVDYYNTTLYASWDPALQIDWDGTTNGGSVVTTTNEYFVGDPFGELPASPTKAGYTFIGWFTTATGKTFITEQTIVDSSHTHLYARYMDFQNSTQFQIQPTSTSYRKAGIYSATRRSSSDVIAVDWGDGKTSCIDGNISQIVHEYASTGTYTVKVSDNISDMRISYNNSTWYQTTTSLRYNFKKMLAWSTNVTQLLDRAFYYCYNMSEFVFPIGITSIPTYLLYYCYNLQNIDIPSTVTSFQNYAFQGCYNLKSVVIPSGVSNLASYTFAGCYSLTSITCQRTTAPTANYGTFGYSTYSPYYYTGYGTRSTGNNTLNILPIATGYDTGYWSSPLRNASYCGFSVKYIGDPCYVTFDATSGSFENGVSSKTIEYIQNAIYGSLPIPIAPLSAPYLSGWFDDPIAGNKITNNSIVPETSVLTLYARYTDQFQYTQLKYIESTGTQYINTGIKQKSNTVCKIKYYGVQCRTGVWDQTNIFGVMQNDSPNGNIIGRMYPDYGISSFNPWFSQDSSVWNVPTLSTAYVNQMNDVEVSWGKCVFNGVNVEIPSQSTTMNDYEIYLFCANLNNSPSRPSYIRVESFQIYEENDLVLDLVPTKDGNDVVCMFDNVSQTYFYNQGTGDFIAGPVIDPSQIISFASPGIDELDRFYCTIDSMTLPQKSFTLWAKLDGPIVSPNERHALFKLGGWNSGIGLMMNDASTSNCDVLFEVYAWGTNITVANPTNWHHYAVVFGTSNIKLYVDGELKTTMSNSYITPQSDFGICGYGKPSSEYGQSYKRTMNGKVCRMAIFNKELSQAEVAADMQLQSQSPNSSDLLHLWTSSINDDIGNWNLTIGGNAYISNETPWN